MTRSLEEALAAGPLFFEPVPPPARTTASRFEERLSAVVELVRRTPRVDALDVPELVDENHEGKPRYRSGDIRTYALALQERTGRVAIVNKVVAHLEDSGALEEWARETVARGIRYAVLVGGASRYIPYPGPGVIEANRRCRPIFRAVGGGLGNIAIPQRTGEAHRMLAKTRAGAAFFTTQILFDADQVVQLVREYDLLCRQATIPPVALVVSFAPIADEQDVEFVRWLGADISETAEAAILGEDESQVAQRSEARALLVWRTLTKTVKEEGLTVPLGVNVEQISPRHLDPAAHLLSEFAEQLPGRG